MTINDKISDEYDINREALKTSSLPSGKIDKYLTGEKVLPFNQRQIMKQAKVAYFSWGKASEKQTKTIEKQGEKQTKAIKKSFLTDQKSIVSLFSKDFLNEKTTYELKKIEAMEI